jgi:fucose permease
VVKIVALFCSFGLGVCFSLLGAISVKLMPRLKIDQARFGTLVTGFMSACLVASLLMGVVTDRLGHKPVAVFGFAMAAVCIFLLARSKSYATVLGSCLLLGFGAMALNTAANTLLPRVLFEGKRPLDALNLGNVAFGVGLLLAPLVMSFLFRKMSYENTVSVIALVLLAPVALAAAATYPVGGGAAFQFSKALALLGEPVVLVAALALFCYSSLDVSFSNWLPAYGKEVLAASGREVAPDAVDASAQRLISVYAVAIILGRLVASQMSWLIEYASQFARPRAVIEWGQRALDMLKNVAPRECVVFAAASLAVALLIGWMTWTRRPTMGRLLILAVGLLSAPFFPLIVGTTNDRTNPAMHGSVFGIIFAGALLGGATVPKAIGNLARGSSIRKSMILLAPLCVVLALAVLFLGHFSRVAQ